MSKVISKEACPNCQEMGGDTSGNNLINWADGGQSCFACGLMKGIKEAGSLKRSMESLEIKAIPTRKIHLDTAQRFGVQTDSNGVNYFNIYQDGDIIATKCRRSKEDQWWPVNGKCDKMFGQGTTNPSQKIHVVITEGEYDAMVVNQETGFPAVSVTKGAQGAVKQIKANLNWLQQWKYVVLCFDNDDAGQAAIKECIKLFEPGMVRVARLPLKDANDMLLAGRGGELKKYIWDAEIIGPKSIVTPKDLRDKVLLRPELGSPQPWISLTQATYGFYIGELYVLAAGPGIGKTEFVREMVNNVLKQGYKVGLFSLEQKPEDTLQRLVGGRINKRLHIPGSEIWNTEAIAAEVDDLNDKVYLFNTEINSISLEQLILNIRFMAKAYGVKFVVLDNLKALCAYPTIEGKHVSDSDYVGVVVGRLFSVLHELNITVLAISHLAKNKLEGSSWSQGRQPTMEDIFGSASVGILADYVIGLSRNTYSQNTEVKSTTTVQMLKTRRDSTYTGMKFYLRYNYETGKLEETQFNEQLS